MNISRTLEVPFYDGVNYNFFQIRNDFYIHPGVKFTDDPKPVLDVRYNEHLESKNHPKMFFDLFVQNR